MNSFYIVKMARLGVKVLLNYHTHKFNRYNSCFLVSKLFNHAVVIMPKYENQVWYLKQYKELSVGCGIRANVYGFSCMYDAWTILALESGSRVTLRLSNNNEYDPYFARSFRSTNIYQDFNKLMIEMLTECVKLDSLSLHETDVLNQWLELMR